MRELSGNPSYSIKSWLRVLEQKGHVRHEEAGRRFVYMPVVRRNAVRKSALRHVVDTFFDGSVEKKWSRRCWAAKRRASPTTS